MKKMILLLLAVWCEVVITAQSNTSNLAVEGTLNEVKVEQIGDNSSVDLIVTSYKGYYLLSQYGSELSLNGEMLGEWNITHTDQYGLGSIIDIYQSTLYNKLYIYQDGQNHNAQIVQDFGGTYEQGYNRAYIYQEGLSQSASIQQLGTRNMARIYQDIPKVEGYNTSRIVQDGADNDALIKQSESHNLAEVIQKGNFLEAIIDQVTPDGLFDTENEVYVLQTGWTGKVYVYQDGARNYVSLNQSSSEGGVGIDIIQKNNTNPLMGHHATIYQGVGWDGSCVNQSSTWSDILNLSISGEMASARINQTNGILLNKTESNLIDANVGGRTATLDVDQGGEGNKVYINASPGQFGGVSVDQSMAIRDNLVDINLSGIYSNYGYVLQNGAAENNVARINQTSATLTDASIEQSGVGNVAHITQDDIMETSASIIQHGTFVYQNSAAISQTNTTSTAATIEQYEGEFNGNRASIIQENNSSSSASIVQSGDWGNSASIEQKSSNGNIDSQNEASINQVANYGMGGNTAFVMQEGSLNRATLAQLSSGQEANITQQDGNNEIVSVQVGSGINYLTTKQSGISPNVIEVSQRGYAHSVKINQDNEGSDDYSVNKISLYQSGSFYTTNISQSGENNFMDVEQSGFVADNAVLTQMPSSSNNKIDVIQNSAGNDAVVVQTSTASYNKALVNQQSSASNLGFHNSANIEQSGYYSGSTIAQSDQYSSVATIEQSGVNNFSAISQFEGEDNTIAINQSGIGNEALVQQEYSTKGSMTNIQQAGINNSASIYQSQLNSTLGGTNAIIVQKYNLSNSSAIVSQVESMGNTQAGILQYNGTNLYAKVDQALGVSFAATIEQYGAGNTALITQTGNDSGYNTATILQGESGNVATILQSGTHNSTSVVQGY